MPSPPPPSSPSPPPLTLLYLCTSNVCRSPLASAIATSLLSSLPSPLPVTVISRGITDGYSAWKSPADERMHAAAEELSRHLPRNLAGVLLASLRSHESRLLTVNEAADPNTVIFLMTAAHGQWAGDLVGESTLSKASKDGRVRLVDSKNGDVADPYFGTSSSYTSVGRHILSSVPVTAGRVLVERGVVTEEEWSAVAREWKVPEEWGDAGEVGRRRGEEQRR